MKTSPKLEGQKIDFSKKMILTQRKVTILHTGQIIMEKRKG